MNGVLRAAAAAVEYDTRTGSVAATDEVLRLFGCEHSEAMQALPACMECVIPEDRNAFLEAVRGVIPEAEFRIRRKDNRELRWILCRSNGSQNGMVGSIVFDVTSTVQRYERQLRLFDGVVTTTPDFVYLFDLQGRFLYANRRLLAVWGMELPSVIGKTCRELGYEQWHHDMHMREIAQVIATKASIKGEVPFKAPLTGVFGVYEYIFTPVLNTDGEVEIIAGTTRDVTGRKQAEEALRASEERFRALLTATSDVVYQMSADWKEMRNLRGRNFIPDTESPSEDWLAQYIDREDQPHVLSIITAAIRAKSVFELEHRVIRVDGTLGWTFSRAVPLQDGKGEITEWFGAASDITQRKKAEEELRAREEQFRTLFESMNEGLALHKLILDAAGNPCDARHLAVNPAFEHHTGMKSEDVLGRTTREVFPDLDPIWIERYGRVALTGEPLRFEEWFEALQRWLDIGVFRIGPSRFGVTFSDITERKRAEENVRRLNAELEDRVRQRTGQLEASNQELESFAYSVSHDLRAPLRGIDGWSLALVEDYADQLDDRAHKYLERVRSEAQRMGVLIDDMLQLSRIARSEMKSSTVDLTAATQTIAARLRDAHSERNIEFVISPRLKCTGDIRLLEVALTNLFSNAVKFTAPRVQARIEFGARYINGERIFFVTDNGVGFDMAFASMLFGTFQRLHKASEFPGTGIGLATVQRIVHRHGGRIWANAQTNQGATFYFTIGSEQR